MNTGSPLFGRPSMGAWITYGIGSESRDLPGFVVLQSGPRGPRGGAPNWGSGFLPTTYQGVPLRSTGAPILNLESPAGIGRDDQRRFVDAVNDFNRLRLADTGDGEIATRIAAYEMAFRMQASAPELMDLSGEIAADARSCTASKPGKPSFANELPARPAAGRAGRAVRAALSHRLGPSRQQGDGAGRIARQDLPRDRSAGRGAGARTSSSAACSDDTLVVWGGEFGRTPQGEPRDMMGRDHHIEVVHDVAGRRRREARPVARRTDEIGYYGVEDVVHVHDLHATILHLLGLDHLQAHLSASKAAISA